MTEDKITEKQIEKIIELYKKLCKEHNLDEQKYDIKSHLDRSLTYRENLNKIMTDLKPLIPKAQAITNSTRPMSKYKTKQELKKEQELKEQAEREELTREEQQQKAEFEKSIREIATSDTAEVSDYFKPQEQIIDMVAKGYSNACVIKGSGGIGKTYLTLTKLEKVKEQMEKEGKTLNVEYNSTYSTPLALYIYLYEHNDENTIIVIDDCEGIFTNPVSISIMKSATWTINGNRNINYLTTSDKLETTDKKGNKVRVPNNFNFKSRLAILVNTLEDNEELNALVTRAIYTELNFSFEQLIKIMYGITKKPYKDLTLEERNEVMAYIKENSNEATDLNFRTLIKAYDIYRYAKAHKTDYKQLTSELLQQDEETLKVLELMKETNIENRNRRWLNETGKSIRTLLRRIKEIKKKRGFDKKTEKTTSEVVTTEETK